MACYGTASSLRPFPTASQPHDREEDDPHHHLPSSSLCSLPHRDYNYNVAAALLGKRSMEMHWVRLGDDSQARGEDHELPDDCSQLGEKKRRLKLEQVTTLEKNFELGSRLEPERKMQLARALGLHPRQIAIWFQNRRARWKTKQLEKDYDALKNQFQAVKFENDALHAYNKKLQAEIVALNRREITSSEPNSLNKETEVSCGYRSDNSSDFNLEITRSTPPNADATHLLRQCQKVEHSGGQADDEDAGFCNVFYSLVDVQPAEVRTPWQQQQGFQ